MPEPQPTVSQDSPGVPMSQLPIFTDQGYHVQRQLGQNRAGGRMTYLAQADHSPHPVVLKEFLFGDAAQWSAYDSCEREIQVLKGLDHPGIPRYLDSFETDNGFCLVQEYKPAPSLAEMRSFSPEEVKEIAIALLEILVYLQNRIPPVIHRDIKPENVLVSEQPTSKGRQVYLVDFGFARIGQGDVAMSSVVKGTLGFMPPEQLFNRPLTEASDLYGVGATLICLLTGTKSQDIGELMDDRYSIEFESRVPKLSLRWVDWLKTLVQPSPSDRYTNAAEALAALKPIYVNRVPKVVAKPDSVVLEATQLGEHIAETVMLKNPVPETVLQGRWRVLPHPKDPPSHPGKHHWLRVTPDRVEGKQVLCRVRANTGKLVANSVYERRLVFESNAEPQVLELALTVKTAPAPVRLPALPTKRLGVLFVSATVLSFGVHVWWGTLVALADALAQALDKL
ncbi:MAG: serine/threonine-protein kinase [Sodalinema sp.]|uniref:serine/threonine protein kinase n=1 Tax=Sodalinema sp. TaxID=3080550 RepID=UPI00120B728A|nr:MAG: serine/threonine protein kinase [Phormidium sp. SL48-SHIP]